jgi:hypothetical protein
MCNTTTPAGAIILLSLISGSALPQQIYRLTELPLVGQFVSAEAINEAGQVTGIVGRHRGTRVEAFLYGNQRPAL